jgi:hypothetical protein
MNGERTIAYFSMEIGIDSAMPTYSGGLGVLAGDMIRSAADLKVQDTYGCSYTFPSKGLLSSNARCKRLAERGTCGLGRRAFFKRDVTGSLSFLALSNISG